MAVIQYSGLVSQVRGKIQGTVFSKGPSGFTAYKKGVPRRLKTSEQLRVMQGMSTNGHTWNLLSPEDKQVWTDIATANPVPNRIGELVTLTGYHYYRSITAKVWPLGTTVALVPDPMAGAAQEITFQVDALVLEAQSNGFLVVQLDLSGETINNVSGDLFAVVWISNPVATLNSKYWGTYYRVATQPVTGAGGASQPVSLALSGEILPTGFRTFEGAFHVVKLQYIRPESGAVGVEQFASVQVATDPPWSGPVFYQAVPAPFIESGPDYGFPDAYWSDPGNTINDELYDFITQLAPFQVDQTPVNPVNWSSSYQAGSYAGISDDIIGVYAPNDFDNPTILARSLFPSSVVLNTTMWLPIRSRLVRLSDSEEGPWINGFLEVTLYEY